MIALALAGCVGALVGGKPAQLYRFGAARAAATASGPASPALRTVVLAPPLFASEVAGTRLLTVAGGKASYVKDARWVAPAGTLFAAALKAEVARRTPWLAMADRRGREGELALRVTVDRFEAAFGAGAPAAPTVVVAGEAVLLDDGGRPVGRYLFTEREPAAADRTGAIVAAFDAATTRVVAGAVDWIGRTPVAGSGPHR